MIRKHARTGHAGTRGAFTLIELLVVVAIIALLISILLPSLARAREGARATMCLAGLKQMSGALLMYIVDSKSVLPGPVHNPIYHQTEQLLSRDGPATWWSKVNLPYYLGPYIGDKSGRAELLDRVATCPSAQRIPVADDSANPSPTYRLHVNGAYIANTGGGYNTQRPTGPYPTNLKVYYGTSPQNYFGWTNVPLSLQDADNDKIWDYFDPVVGTAVKTQAQKDRDWPKKIDRIKKQSEEWMLADLWYWDARAGAFGATAPCGTWMYGQGISFSGSVMVSGQLKVPSFPFHYTMKTFRPDLAAPDHILGNERLMSGKTNAAYFDGHGDSVRPWLGTVNPQIGQY